MQRPLEPSEANVQSSAAGATPPAPLLNPASPVLPGEDPAAFQALLEDLYAVHRPRTRNEARCVDALAEYEWCLQRSRRMRQHYHAKLLALHAGGPDADGAVHCERDPHRWHHSAMDCSLEAGRLCRLQELELRKLTHLKKQRLQNLTADVAEMAEHTDVVVPRETISIHAGPGTAPPHPGTHASARNGKGSAPPRSAAGRSPPNVPVSAQRHAGPDRPHRLPQTPSAFTEIGAPSG